MDDRPNRGNEDRLVAARRLVDAAILKPIGNRLGDVLLNILGIRVGVLPRTATLTWCFLVGVAGFEPAASSSRTKRAAKLRYTPPTESGV